VNETMRVTPIAVSLFLASAAASGKEPIFVPIKIDGPVHDPAKDSTWHGPFSEGSAVFDVDGDGAVDITCGANWYQGPEWKKHEGFRPSASVHGEFVNNCGEYPLDVNGDGKKDLISAGWMRNGVYWYENPGKAGEPWKETKILDSDFTEGLIVEDIDGDGDEDVLPNHWGPKDGQAVTWIENQGGAKFAPRPVGKEGDVHGIGLGDVNGDGRKDIVTPRGWWEAPADRAGGKWTFHADYKLRHEGGIRMPVIDVNGDGKNDIIYGHGHNYGLGWLEQGAAPEAASGGSGGGGAAPAAGGLTFRDHEIEDSAGQFHTLVLADVDQDGKLDLVTGKRLRGHGGDDPSSFDPLGVYWYDIQGGKFAKRVLSYNHIVRYEGKETRNPAPNFAIGTGMNINVADVNKDGKVDIVVGGKSGLYLFENRGLPPTARMDK
jgi:hypothetical protein